MLPTEHYSKRTRSEARWSGSVKNSRVPRRHLIGQRAIFADFHGVFVVHRILAVTHKHT